MNKETALHDIAQLEEAILFEQKRSDEERQKVSDKINSYRERIKELQNELIKDKNMITLEPNSPYNEITIKCDNENNPPEIVMNDRMRIDIIFRYKIVVNGITHKILPLEVPKSIGVELLKIFNTEIMLKKL